MVNNKEIVGFGVTECHGATSDPVLFIHPPAKVTIDIAKSGDRRVTCPYLISEDTTIAINGKTLTYRSAFCSLFKIINPLSEQLEITIDQQLANRLANPVIFNDPIKIVLQNHPLCIQKYPS